MWQLKNQAHRFSQRYYLSILSGLLIGTSYIPFPPWAIFFCYLPLWIAWIKQPQLKSILIHAWITNFILTAIGFHWIAHTAHEFGQLDWISSSIVLLAFCAFNNIFIVVAGLIWWLIIKYLKPSQRTSIILLPFICVSAETFAHGIFPWNFGYSWLYMNWPGFQLAEFVGFYGLSLAVFLTNGLLLLAWIRRHHRYRLAIYFGTALVFVTGINVLGYIRSQQIEEGDTTLNIVQVQANIGNIDKIYAIYGGRATLATVNQFESLTTKAIEKFRQESPEAKINLIVWPETAFPSYLNSLYRGTHLNRRLTTLIRRWDAPLFTGGYTKLSQDAKTYNSVYLFDERGNQIGTPYHKTILLAFGEYLPGERYIGFIRKWVTTISDFGVGPGPQVLPFGDYTIGPQICYEGLYPEFSNKLSSLGADFIINVTNDSWFGKHAEPYQHLYMTLARAVETRKPLIRNTNTGITTAITRKGRILELSPIHAPWAHVFEVPILKNSEPTYFTKQGYRLPYLVILLAIAIALFGGINARIRKS